MPNNSRTLWTEGMFLGPQHFQQQDRFLLHAMAQLFKASGPYAEGVTRLDIDEAALAQGKFAILAVSGVFPDSTPFELPGDGPLPAPLEISPGSSNLTVMLALPMPEHADKDVAETAEQASFARYLFEDQLIADRHTLDADGQETVFTAGLWTRLVPGNAEHAAYHTLPIARIVERRDNDTVILDRTFWPCALAASASPGLQAMLRDIQGLLAQRSREIASQLGSNAASSGSQLTQLLLLQVLNRALPLVTHDARTGALHPERVYRDLAQLAGELATITHDDRLAPEFTEYLHRDQYRSFDPLVTSLRKSLNWIPDSATRSFAVEHVKAGIYTATVPDLPLFHSARFILAANARVTPEELSRRLPRQSTIASKAKLRNLVEAQSQGIELKPMVTVPNSIPMYDNYVYFEMKQDDPLWDEIARSGDIALHIAGAYSDLTMQLWTIGQ